MATDNETADEPQGLVFQGNGNECRFCGATAGELAPTGNEYRAFWELHEAAAHKREAITARLRDGSLTSEDAIIALFEEGLA